VPLACGPVGKRHDAEDDGDHRHGPASQRQARPIAAASSALPSHRGTAGGETEHPLRLTARRLGEPMVPLRHVALEGHTAPTEWTLVTATRRPERVTAAWPTRVVTFSPGTEGRPHGSPSVGLGDLWFKGLIVTTVRAPCDSRRRWCGLSRASWPQGARRDRIPPRGGCVPVGGARAEAEAHRLGDHRPTTSGGRFP